MLSSLINDNYSLTVNNLTLIDSHFGTEIFLLETDCGKYIVKTVPLNIKGIETEGDISQYLLNNGVKTAKFQQTKNGKFYVKTDEFQFHVQEFVEGGNPAH